MAKDDHPQTSEIMTRTKSGRMISVTELLKSADRKIFWFKWVIIPALFVSSYVLFIPRWARIFDGLYPIGFNFGGHYVSASMISFDEQPILFCLLVFGEMSAVLSPLLFALVRLFRKKPMDRQDADGGEIGLPRAEGPACDSPGQRPG